MRPQSTLSHFQNTFGTPEIQVLAPGRVNIIGEHTDYSGGDVLPFATSKNMCLIGKKSRNPFSRIYAINFDQNITITPDNLPPTNHWSRYFISAIQTLEKHNFEISAIDISFGSDIPIGAGVSSSSAMTCGFIKLASELFNLSISDKQLITLASIAENHTGVLGGIMDQTAIVCSTIDKAIHLNCDSGTYKYVSSQIPNHEWLLINSGVQHNLALTDYNNRSTESKKALQLIQSAFPEVQNLRDINKEHLDFLRFNNALLSRRARHFFNEQKRVIKMITALKLQEAKKIGALLYQCHESLATLYEVSCDEIDFIISNLKELQLVKGARIMGGGFGGSIICLIEKDSQQKIMSQISTPYYNRFNKELSSFIACASDGLKIIS